MNRNGGHFLRFVLNLLMLILILSAFGITLADILRFDWFDTIGTMLINFFIL